MLGRRGRDAHVNFASAGIPHHLDQFNAGRAADDRIVDEHNSLTVHQRRISVVFKLDPKVPNFLRGLDEGAADIVRTNDAELERDSAGLRKSDRCRHAAIRNWYDVIDVDGRFPGKLRADVLTHFVDRHAFRNGIRPREINMLEDARARAPLFERPVGSDAAVVDDYQLARLDIAKETGADHVERDSLAGENRRFAQLAHHQRTNAERIAAGDQTLLGEANERVSPFDLLQRVGQP